MDVLLFTVTRASTPARLTLLNRTISQAREKAGMPFTWHIVESGVSAVKVEDGVDIVTHHDENVGQHVAWNEIYHKRDDAQYIIKVDDDCEFLTHAWLRKLVDASIALDDKMILAPAVRGLKHPPTTSQPLSVHGIPLRFLVDAIGGVCRLHPVPLLQQHNYLADVRWPLGGGDATGIAHWCRENMIPMAYVTSVRVRHSTAKQEAADPTHFSHHPLLQAIPYIPS